MQTFALIAVPSDWTSEQPYGVSQATYEQYHREIQADTRLLVFQIAPSNRIVAEATVLTSWFEKVADWPQPPSIPPVTAHGEPAEYVLPLRIVFSYQGVHPVPLEEIRRKTGLEQIAEYHPIDVATYQALRRAL
ncbi:MAG: hypothetical protein MUF87_16470 [Anaerolineae bacterium]|jgi:hypothetical protein|nr:hypothetical protein [Anaerolineae bacterium]